MSGPVFLEGDGVALCPADQSDLNFLRTHENDPRVRKTRTVRFPTSTDHATTRLGGTMGRNEETVGLVIRADDESVGFVYLLREDPNAIDFRYAELAYWIAYEHWDAGYATAAAKTMVKYGFDELGLHRITASTLASNESSKRVLEKVGFEREGVAREEVYTDGEWHDRIRYGLLADEWRADNS
ncbi:GNAT family N-acetyltransferase [Halogeometricum borinquense]|uniref:Acetyltransferase, ribosomal protein N-acetylase n=1 Tax=Halogeometricum borinquense (strain ATCC 700274 / DSM 11551 / JCM 10706 / KCTC 4070 / PR3) TaxID=469382 RepID=E4NWH6_HALBP|nr:GNAT family protein [Halogeometricum borinquense]ADQ69396.1 acetyltransferase, ribosomal protein N-acetylase [Halogeometricum borinquense DSM 11551]